MFKFSVVRPDVSRRGFTLIELMIVVAVIAILSAIVYPMYTNEVRKSRRGIAKADLVELGQRLERYYTINNSYEGFALGTTPGTFTVSPHDGGTAYYNLSINNLSASAFTLQAAPIGDQQKDSCGTLTYDQVGRKASSSGSDCW